MKHWLIIVCVFLCRCGESNSAPADSDPALELHGDKTQTAEVCRPRAPRSFYEENHTYLRPSGHAHLWEVATPEDVGLDSRRLQAALTELKRSKSVYSFLVVRHGRLVFESYLNGSKSTDANNIHSASKSILSSLVGIAIRFGFIRSLDDRIGDYLGKKFLIDESKASITVKDLLVMQSGWRWEEDASEYAIEEQSNWVQAILNLPQDGRPGAKFLYSTAASHLLSALLTEASGKSICEFAMEYLYKPLKIEPARWGNDPQGYFSGGYNVFMTPRELARFAYQYAAADRSNSIIPEEWMIESLEKHVRVDRQYSYGYQWWLRSIGDYDVAKMWGYGGQFSYVIRELGMVVTMTTNTKDFDSDWDGDELIRNYVLPKN